MKISLFYEFALPRPWSDDDEHVLLKECLDEVEAMPAPVALVTLAEGKFFSNGLDLDWLAAAPR